MPRDKTASHLRVDRAIREEFAEKGFECATIRSIGERAGMTSAGLYRHYKDKEEMFASIVQPLIDEVGEWTRQHKEKKYAMLDADAEKDSLFGESVLDMIRDVVLPKRDDFRLLLCKAQGTRYENFVHEYVEQNQSDFEEAIRCMKLHGYPAKELTKEELHMLLSSYTTACFEPIIHEYDDDKINSYLETINDFFMPGWLKIMGLS